MPFWDSVGWWPQILRINSGTMLVGLQPNQQQPGTISMDVLLEYLRTNFASPSFQTQFITPTTGFSVAVTDNGQSTWMIIQPAGTLATGSITLPLASGAADGQEVMVTTTQEITAFSISGNGALAVFGAPTTLAAESAFRMRFYSVTSSWYVVT